MNKLIKGIVVTAAVVIGLGGAYFAAQALSNRVGSAFFSPQVPRDLDGMPGWELGPRDRDWNNDGRFPRSGMGRGMMYPGQFNGYPPGSGDAQLERIDIDTAAVYAQEYADVIGENLRVVEVMEFEDNFYAVVMESETGKGAFELLVDAYGNTAREMGPGVMWNTKYGHMRNGGRTSTSASATNKVIMEQAITFAQKALDAQVPGAVLSEHGIDFYGYYSFDYEIDGDVAGMLSVNGQDGAVWFHTWHGSFISEKEIGE